MALSYPLYHSGKDTALPCPLCHSAATGIDIKAVSLLSQEIGDLIAIMF